MDRADLAAPFITSMLLYLVSPLLSRQVGRTISAQIDQGRTHVSRSGEDRVPYYLAPQTLSDYIEYSLDAIQVFPTFLLPIVGALFDFSSGVPPLIALGFLIITCVTAIGMSAWILTRAAPDYVSRKWRGYSIMMLIGLGINAAGLTMTLVFV